MQTEHSVKRDITPMVKRQPFESGTMTAKKMTELWQRIDDAIERSGYTNAELSRLFEIHRMSVGNWRRPKEKGGVRPDHDKLLPLARLLKIRIEWLLAGEGEMQADERADRDKHRPGALYLEEDLLIEIVAKVDEIAARDGVHLNPRTALLVAITAYRSVEHDRKDGKIDAASLESAIRAPLRLATSIGITVTRIA